MVGEKCDNPWAVTSIDSFNFFCCPECVFRSKENVSFENHAAQNHPKSKAFFGNCVLTVWNEKNVKAKTEEESNTDLFFCCPQCPYKSEDSNLFQIHALEEHPASQQFFTRDTNICKTGNHRKQHQAGLSWIGKYDQLPQQKWDKKNLCDFNFYCCLKCTFRSKFIEDYRRHQISQHPEPDCLNGSFEIKDEDFDIHFESKPQFSEELIVQEPKDTNDVKLTVDSFRLK